MKTFTIKGSLWSICIGGFREVKVSDPMSLIKMVSEAAAPHYAQLVDADWVAGWEHLHMAAVNASKATETGVAISKSIQVETLLYASAQDQITTALSRLGVTLKTRYIALLIFAPSRDEAEAVYRRTAEKLGEEDDSVLILTPEKTQRLKKIYNVSDQELEAAGGDTSLTSLIVERGALLSLRH